MSEAMEDRPTDTVTSETQEPAPAVATPEPAAPAVPEPAAPAVPEPAAPAVPPLPEPAAPVRTFTVAQRGAALIYRPPAWSDATDGSPVGQLRSANRLIRERTVVPVWPPHRDPALWADGAPPDCGG